MKWDNKVFIDLALCLGLGLSPGFKWIINAAQRRLIYSHYINNLLTSRQPSTFECSKNLQIILCICEWLGLPLKVRNIEDLSPVLGCTLMGHFRFSISCLKQFRGMPLLILSPIPSHP